MCGPIFSETTAPSRPAPVTDEDYVGRSVRLGSGLSGTVVGVSTIADRLYNGTTRLLVRVPRIVEGGFPIDLVGVAKQFVTVVD